MSFKVLAMSDLHTEFAPFHLPIDLNPDLIVLAGDIAHDAAGVVMASRNFLTACPKIVICGNHEFYLARYEDVLVRCRSAAAVTDNVFFLERNEVVLPIRGEYVRVLGCVLWTDFLANGSDRRQEAIEDASRMLSDFRLITFRGQILTPEDTIGLHEASLQWLQSRLSKPHYGPTIVVTHHAPSSQSQPPQFIGGKLAPAFVSNIEDMVLAYQPELWVHGRTHWFTDYHLGKTRIYSNQRGYPGEACGFRLELIEICRNGAASI